MCASQQSCPPLGIDTFSAGSSLPLEDTRPEPAVCNHDQSPGSLRWGAQVVSSLSAVLFFSALHSPRRAPQALPRGDRAGWRWSKAGSGLGLATKVACRTYRLVESYTSSSGLTAVTGNLAPPRCVLSVYFISPLLIYIPRIRRNLFIPLCQTAADLQLFLQTC